MKKPKAVADAEARLAAKRAEHAAAMEAVYRLQTEVREAAEALQEARVQADAGLPQCRLMRFVGWNSQTEQDAGRAVILRRTPGGQLAARSVGATDDAAMKFKWNKYTGRFEEAGKRTSGYGRNRLVLRDVPAEYMPTEQETAR